MADWVGEGGKWLRGIGFGAGGGVRGEEEGAELLAEIQQGMKPHSEIMEGLVERQHELVTMAEDESTASLLPTYLVEMTVRARAPKNA